MPSFTQGDLPDEVGRSTLDPEVAEWLKEAPSLGAHEPIYAMRNAHHRAFVPETPRP